ncbi:MAG: hypothetical protein ABII19_01345 [Patescibacteria group bacterium]
MSINNPAEEQHREQLKMHAEDLQRNDAQIIAELSRVFGSGNFSVDKEGNVSCSESDLELGEGKAIMRKEAEEKLRGIHREIDSIKESDPDVWKETIH